MFPTDYSNQVRSNYTYNVAVGQRYFITIKMKNRNGGMSPVRILADSGNDITILTHNTAKSLGYEPSTMTNTSEFHVKGINGKPAVFKEINVPVTIGNVELTIPVGLATKDEDLSDNLLGRQGVLDSGKIGFNFDHDSVEIVDKRFKEVKKGMRVSVCGAGSFSNCQ